MALCVAPRSSTRSLTARRMDRRLLNALTSCFVVDRTAPRGLPCRVGPIRGRAARNNETPSTTRLVERRSRGAERVHWHHARRSARTATPRHDIAAGRSTLRGYSRAARDSRRRGLLVPSASPQRYSSPANTLVKPHLVVGSSPRRSPRWRGRITSFRDTIRGGLTYSHNRCRRRWTNSAANSKPVLGAPSLRGESAVVCTL